MRLSALNRYPLFREFPNYGGSPLENDAYAKLAQASLTVAALLLARGEGATAPLKGTRDTFLLVEWNGALHIACVNSHHLLSGPLHLHECTLVADFEGVDHEDLTALLSALELWLADPRVEMVDPHWLPGHA